jgi:hypothetical protein
MIKAIIIGLAIVAAAAGGYAVFHKSPAKSPSAGKAVPATTAPSTNSPASPAPAPSTPAPAASGGSPAQSDNSSPAPAYPY